MASRPPGSFPPLSCWHPLPIMAGLVGLVVFGVVLWMSFFDGKDGQWSSPFFMILVTGCAYMILYSGKMTLDERGVTKVCLLGTYFIAWESITEISTGAGNMVIRGKDQRLVLPGPEHWLGGDARNIKGVFQRFCQLNELTIDERLSAIVTFTSKGTRVR